MRKLKQGMVIVMDEDIFSDNIAILISSKIGKVLVYNVRNCSVVFLEKEELLDKIKKQLWWVKVPEVL